VSEAGDLDFLWTEFMVTGSKEAVIKIIESLDQDSSSSESFLLACAADWSLNNNCREHKKVLEICEEELLRVNDPIKRILEAVLDEAKIFDVLKKTERCENEGKASEQTMKPKGQKEDKVTGAKAWALGCSAVLSERNHYRHDLLGYSL
jgi:hypothetical protein